MKTTKIKKLVRGHSAVDGAGVKLVRVLGLHSVEDFDPFLMLDSFDSKEPADYTAGFPTHPHRGIETVTYLIEGIIEHQDTLGNKGTILSGHAQWMTAGSGIMHAEMPKASQRMLGFQLWINLPQSEKMADPAYLAITDTDIASVTTETAVVRVISGNFHNTEGVKTHYIPTTLLDFTLEAGKSTPLPTKPDETAFIFLIEGDAVIDGELVSEKTAVLLDSSGEVTVHAPAEQPLRFLFFSAKPLKEPVAWGGPIVMNTNDELKLAFSELKQGDFIKNGQKI